MPFKTRNKRSNAFADVASTIRRSLAGGAGGRSGAGGSGHDPPERVEHAFEFPHYGRHARRSAPRVLSLPVARGSWLGGAG